LIYIIAGDLGSSILYNKLQKRENNKPAS
jgi:hypothetical protein